MKIKKSCFSEMVKHCRKEYPNEACGILAGKDNLITKVYKMANISEIPTTCYFMDPREQLKVFKEMRNARLEMLGIYHSHVASSPYPSPRDVEMAFYPEASYVIISLTDFHKLEVSSFKIGEGKIEEEEISYKEEEE
ncbi:M67 family metallopeptidase [candidate division NPL-UPA2 bacterium]|nr:M67 family metallopeptidase [candidate division NPL-UPA2 bacterium]